MRTTYRIIEVRSDTERELARTLTLEDAETLISALRRDRNQQVEGSPEPETDWEIRGA